MKGLSAPTGRAPAKRFHPSLESLEERQLLNVGPTTGGMELRLEQSGYTPLTVVDNGPGDMNPASGAIVYMGSYGSFPLNVIAGVSLRDSSTGQQQLLLSSINMAGPEGGTLRVLLSQRDVLIPGDGTQPLLLRSDSGGTFFGPGGSIDLQSYANEDNTSEPSGMNSGPDSPYGGGPFSGTDTTQADPQSGSYSLVNEATISFGGAGITSFALYSTLDALQGPETPEVIDPGLLVEPE